MYTISGPFGATTTPVFKCSATICYSADGKGTSAGTHALFVQLQGLLNRFAGAAGFAPISTDGFIGAGTVAALQRVAAFAQNFKNNPAAPPIGLVLGGFAASKEAVAAGAQALVTNLTTLVGLPSVSSATSTTAPSTWTPASVSVGPTHLPAPPTGLDALIPGAGAASAATAIAPPASGSSKWPFYVGGALVAGALVYAAWAMADSKRPF